MLETQILPCPFCGTVPQIITRGNEHTKRRSVTLWCSECRVERTEAGLILTFDELHSIAKRNWNQRPPCSELAAANARLKEVEGVREKNKAIKEMLYKVARKLNVVLGLNEAELAFVNTLIEEDNAALTSPGSGGDV